MKSNAHFWPAYVDMMTVLLLVYLLITLLFQILMVIAQQNVGIKLRERNQVTTQYFKYAEPVYDEELRLSFQRNQNYLTTKNKDDLIQWAKTHKDAIESQGAEIYATASGEGETQVGTALSLQYDRSLALFSILQSEGISVQKVKVNNASVNKSDQDFVSIRILEKSTVKPSAVSQTATEQSATAPIAPSEPTLVTEGS